MKRIHILTDWFFPGFKADGLVTAALNLSRQLSKTYEVFVLITDRDLGDKKPYSTEILNRWCPFEQDIQICYLSPKFLNCKIISRNVKRLILHFYS